MLEKLKELEKNELIDLVLELETKVDELQDDLTYLECEAYDDECRADDAESKLEDMEENMMDWNEFIWKLKLDNLFTDEIEEFIKYYRRFYAKELD